MSSAPIPSTADVHQRTVDLARQLIACRSLTPDDAGSLTLIGGRLGQAGFVCEHIDRGDVRNLWAHHGTGSPLVCLAGHVDVVPPGPAEQWTSEPFTPTERDGFLFGRGAADMKVSVAAMVTAAERFVAASPDHRGTLAILLTSDEEGTGVDGTAAVVREFESRGLRIDACILGEPFSPARGRIGDHHRAFDQKRHECSSERLHCDGVGTKPTTVCDPSTQCELGGS